MRLLHRTMDLLHGARVGAYILQYLQLSIGGFLCECLQPVGEAAGFVSYNCTVVKLVLFVVGAS